MSIRISYENDPCALLATDERGRKKRERERSLPMHIPRSVSRLSAIASVGPEYAFTYY